MIVRASAGPLTVLAMLLGTALPAVAEQSPEAGMVTVSGQEFKELGHGLIEGYLDEEELLDSEVFVLPAPQADSARQALDTAWADSMLDLRGTPRWDYAILDADLSFPSAAGRFSCAMGLEVSEEDTPTLYMLLYRAMTDLALSTYPAKIAYQRERPFMVADTPVCTPEIETELRGDGSYPSGHTAVGWGWALILTELVPDRADEVIARGRAFGESRNVCNVHWNSDVVAGRLSGAAMIARLNANENFRADVDAAREEVAAVRRTGAPVEADCEAEAAALALP